jgi:hypothetical protein
MSDLKAIFERIAAENLWLNSESRSGDGSTLFYTRHLRTELEKFLRNFAIESIFDAPCGDFNWMKAVSLEKDVAYIGGDIAELLIAGNRKKYGAKGRQFIEFDIVKDAFPTGDMWFCRDCLFHLSNAQIFSALENFSRSNIKLVMMTNHITTTGFKNSDGEAGEFRLVDFFEPPFRLPREVLFRVTDFIEPYPPREMCVWTREQIASALTDLEGVDVQASEA